MIDGLLLVDKAGGVSSHHVVSLARRALGTRDVGHAGTLDPMATGVLVLAVGEALKLLRYLVLDDKRYRAVIALGAETDTLDAEGQVTERAEVPAELSADVVRAAASAFAGTIEQTAPVISALKQEGVPLYKRARRGEAVEAPRRQVVVHAIDVLRVEGNTIELDVACGKGFYVRSLARDLAAALGTKGHLSSLRRTQSGRFTLDSAVGLSLLREAAAHDEAARARLQAAMIPLLETLPGAARVTLDATGVQRARNGRPLDATHTLAGALPAGLAEPVLLLDEAGTLIAVARPEGEGLRVVRGMRSA